MKLSDVRREYARADLHRKDLDADPVTQLEKWLAQAKEYELTDITAMTLSTVDQSGQPSQRVVLLKQLDHRGMVFFTNLNSSKAQDMENNSKVSAHFAWLPLERQVKVKGIATRLSKSEVLSYFVSRPRNSQIGAWASNQSQPISSRKFLLSAFDKMKQKFAEGEVPVPDFWGGYRIEPTEYEFWQGGSARLHDRFLYSQYGAKWKIERLAP